MLDHEPCMYIERVIDGFDARDDAHQMAIGGATHQAKIVFADNKSARTDTVQTLPPPVICSLPLRPRLT